MEEIWRPVPSLDGALEVSSQGRVRRVARPLTYKDGRTGTLKAGILSGGIAKTGYRMVSVGYDKYLVHRLVAEAFHGTPQADNVYKTVNHLNGDKLDNRPENLEWATYGTNNDHARETGLNRQHGEKTNLSRYSDQFVQAIRNVHAAYGTPQAELARLFGISRRYAGQVIRMETRKKQTT